MRKYFLILILGTMLIQNVLALGVIPGRTTLDFESNLQKDVPFSITNSEGKAMSVIFYVKGELKDFVTLSDERADFSSDESSKDFSYSVALPSNLDRPGLYTAEIVAQQVPEDSELEGTTLGATVAVVTQLYVYVPYPDKYPEFEMEILEASPGQITTFLIPVINRGEVDINNIESHVEIYSGSSLIDEIFVPGVSLSSGERKDLIGSWETDADVGRYTAKLILNYDGEEATLEKEFNIGEPKIEIELITVNDFHLGGIAKFNVLVNNKMNQDVNDISVGMVVYGDDQNTVADFKSQNYDVSASNKLEMVAYWDTEGVDAGTYDGKIVLRYNQEKDEKNVKIKVTENNIEVVGLTGRVIVSGDEGFNMTTILIIVIVVLIMGNILWFFVFRRLRQKR